MLSDSSTYDTMVKIFCLAQCPDGTYFDGLTCTNCNSSMPGCSACTSGSSCVSCPTPLIMNYNSNSCECPPHYFINSSTNTCDFCPFDCWTCNNDGNCLSCGSFRLMNGSRCPPLPGFFETNTSIPEPCLNNCLICSSAADCSECMVRSVMLSPTSC